MNALTDRAAPERAFIDAYEARRARLPGAGVPWVEALRDRAAASLARHGIPNRRTEAWKYTDLRAALDNDTVAAPSAGKNSAHVELPKVAGLELLPLREALRTPPQWMNEALPKINPDPEHPIYRLNTMLMDDGFILHIAPGTVVAQPIEIRVQAAGTAHIRMLIGAGAGAKATIIERHENATAPLVTRVMGLRLDDGAEIRHVLVQSGNEQSRHLSLLAADFGTNASYRGFIASQGAALARNEFHLRLGSPGATAELDGLSLLGGTRHCDNTTIVDHAVPHTTSRQNFKSVLTGQSRGVFQGRVLVRPGATGTDANQYTRSMLLSRRAEMNAKPELEILADDVKCNHGAAMGEPDEMALFFLQARGIDELEAKGLLLAGFLEEIVQRLPDEGLQDELRRSNAAWLARELRS